ncbi:MAG: hypothetical protein JXB19_07060, partial [Bacteroidales bacterium]|nr:hypothetical protein [Bacteroidales bacterium]
YNPTETQLLNATKISGRTPAGLGLGFLNAMTLPSNATLKDTLTGETRDIQVQPFTNYNVTVVDKSLPNNSYVGIVNSSVLMANNPFIANVSGTDFQIRNKAKTYAVSGKAGISIRGEQEKETGYYVELGVRKNSGKLQYGISQSINSDKFNINDLGYMRRNNEMITGVNMSYRIHEPFSIFREIQMYSWFDHTRIYNPNHLFMNQAGFDVYTLFKNNYGFAFNINLTGEKYDYYEPRVKNRFYYEPPGHNLNLYVFSDSRKPVRIGLWTGIYKQPKTSQNSYWGESELNVRIGRRYQMGYGIELNNQYNDYGYVDKTGSNDTIYFARRNVKTLENTLGASFVLSNKAGLNLRFRHYWSGAANKDYHQLQQNGTLILDPDYDKNKDANYNAFNVDFVFRWIFAPGSELSVAWKNSILESGNKVVFRYLENLENTWKADQTNSISVKILYYIDYNNLRRKNRSMY